MSLCNGRGLVVPDEVKNALGIYRVVLIDVVTVMNSLRNEAGDVCQLILRDGNTETEFALWSHEMRGDQYRSNTASRKWFKGYVNGNERDIARITIDVGGIEGLFYDHGKAIVIEPLKNYTATSLPGEHVIYEVADMNAINLYCDVLGMEEGRSGKPTARQNNSAPEVRPRLIQIATEASYSFYQRYGADTNDRILTLLNVVEGLYERDFGITFRVTFQHYFDNDNDPYTGDGQELLSQFQDHWNSNWPEVPRHLAFLFHGKLLDSGVLGRAYQGQACEDVSYAYGFMSLSFSAYEIKVTAHEIGHLFGAKHESAESCNALLSVMCTAALVGAPFEFGSEAKADIGAFLDEHDCFELPFQAAIYPVPAVSSITVLTSEPEFSVVLYNSFGQQVFYGQYVTFSGTISLENLSEGMYVARVSAGGKTVSRRIEVIR